MNVGEVANEGWDISVSATPVLTKNFRWDLTANYGIYRNKVVKLADGVPYLEISNIGGGGAKIQAVEGRPMGDIYVQVPQMNENGEYLVSDKGLYMNQTELQRVGNINPRRRRRSVQLVLLQEHLPGFQYRLPHRRRCYQRNEPICHRSGSDTRIPEVP